MRKFHCTFVVEPLNHIHQDMKLTQLITVCKCTFSFDYNSDTCNVNYLYFFTTGGFKGGARVSVEPHRHEGKTFTVYTVCGQSFGYFLVYL